MKRISFCGVPLLALAVAAVIATVVGLHTTHVSAPDASQPPPVVQGVIMNNPDPILYGENARTPLEYFVSPQRASPCKLLAVRITSSPDDTEHRGAMNGSPTRVKNLPDLFGHKIGGTINLESGEDGAYRAATTGGSGHNSSFNWYSSLMKLFDSELFSSNPSIPVYVVPFQVWHPGEATYPGKPPNSDLNFYSQGDDLTIDPADSVNGATAHNSYHTKLHEPYELWIETSLVHHPTDLTKSLADWTYLGPVENADKCAIKYSISIGTSLNETFSNTATFTVPGSPADEIAAMKYHCNFTPGIQTRTVAIAETFTWTIPPHTTAYFYWAPVYTEKAGICSAWGDNGYQGDTTWTARCADPGGVTIAYTTTPPQPLIKMPEAKQAGWS